MISYEELKHILDYNPDTGIFVWKNFGAGKAHLNGKEAGCIRNDPNRKFYRYRAIRRNGKEYVCHRLAWFYMTGEWPKKLLDHINGDPLDNRFVNLRECTDRQNSFNRVVNPRSSTGLKGVQEFKNRKGEPRYRVRIRIDGKRIDLGTYSDINDADAVYKAAASAYQKEFALHTRSL